MQFQGIVSLAEAPTIQQTATDPQQEEVCAAVNLASYNQLVEMIIANKTSKDSELVRSLSTSRTLLLELCCIALVRIVV